MPDSAQYEQVNAAFSKQSFHFDEEDEGNPILQRWRKLIYNHADLFLKPNSNILELNAGTGIDAVRFAQQGHHVLATDLSDGMISKIQEKISKLSLNENISVQQVSFENLNEVQGKFDFVFSNFGGLNCIDELTNVAKHLPRLLNDNAYVTWVIMPRIAPWEWTWIFKGKISEAFRRFRKKGTMAHLEGEYFKTYYHSFSKIRRAFDQNFKIVKIESLGIFSPPPSALHFFKKFPLLTTLLNRASELVRKIYPFNRWGDHLIVTFKIK